MSVVYWDTMLFVYWFEENPIWVDRIEAIFASMETRGDRLVTGAFALGELLVGPKKAGDIDAAERMQSGLMELAEILPFTARSAAHYSAIRANHNVSPAEAIHLATAADAGVDLFLTNDRRLAGKYIPGIQFIAGIESGIL